MTAHERKKWSQVKKAVNELLNCWRKDLAQCDFLSHPLGCVKECLWQLSSLPLPSAFPHRATLSDTMTGRTP